MSSGSQSSALCSYIDSEEGNAGIFFSRSNGYDDDDNVPVMSSTNGLIPNNFSEALDTLHVTQHTAHQLNKSVVYS
jgi:hypothetical protein